MVTVWLRDSRFHVTRFHKSKYCSRLTSRPNGKSRELLEMDLDDVHVRPCLVCYPDAPRIKIRKAYCPVCDSRAPCEHNGGVLVTLRDGRRMHVWPDSNQMPLYRRRA